MMLYKCNSERFPLFWSIKRLKEWLLSVVIATLVIQTAESNNRNYLNEALYELLPSLDIKNSSTTGIKLPLHMMKEGPCSYMLNSLCATSGPGSQRLGCCRPPAPMRALYNAKIEKRKLVVFIGTSPAGAGGGDQSCSMSSNQDWRLPSIKSTVRLKPTESSMSITVREERLDIAASCKRYVNGTLHVIGLQTSHNPFHAMNDNVMPLLSQIILDAHFAPELLFLPRVKLSGLAPDAGSDASPHMQLITDAMSEIMSLNDADGVCFRRILWSEGPRLIYHQSMTMLRRQTADLARALVLKKYNPEVPLAFRGGGDSVNKGGRNANHRPAELGGFTSKELHQGEAINATAAASPLVTQEPSADSALWRSNSSANSDSPSSMGRSTSSTSTRQKSKGTIISSRGSSTDMEEEEEVTVPSSTSVSTVPASGKQSPSLLSSTSTSPHHPSSPVAPSRPVVAGVTTTTTATATATATATGGGHRHNGGTTIPPPVERKVATKANNIIPPPHARVVPPVVPGGGRHPPLTMQRDSTRARVAPSSGMVVRAAGPQQLRIRRRRLDNTNSSSSNDDAAAGTPTAAATAVAAAGVNATSTAATDVATTAAATAVVAVASVLKKIPLPPSPSRPLVVNGRPLNIVIFSRGDSGKGRTIQGEDRLANSLIDAGAHAFVLSDYKKTTFSQQLGYAVHADVIIGMHGAGLMNIIFAPRGVIMIELKTLYAYTLNLFSIATEARMGIHTQVNIKDYFFQGGHKPVDNNLIRRVKEVLLTALKMRSSPSQSRGGHDIVSLKNEDIVTRLSQSYTGDIDLDHILGPRKGTVISVCKQRMSAMARYKKMIGADDALHCIDCG